MRNKNIDNDMTTKKFHSNTTAVNVVIIVILPFIPGYDYDTMPCMHAP